MFKKNVELGKAISVSSFRKVAIGTWRDAKDPSVYGSMDVEVERALQFLEMLNQKHGSKVTITHFVGKALAEAFAKHPDINCVLRFGRLYPRKSVDIHYLVASDDKGKDLTGTAIRGADKKTLLAVAQELSQKARSIREKGDVDFKQVKKTMKLLPGWLVGCVLDLTSFIMYTLNIWSPLMGSPRDPFGSVIVTNIGSLGLDEAYVPLVPYSRCPVLICVGVIREVPAVKNGQVVVVKKMKLCTTFDHRLIDGMHASHMVKMIHKFFERPEDYLKSDL